MYAYDCRTLLCAHVKIVLYLIVIILPWKIFIIFSLGFDLPVGSKILISGTQILTTPIENKNFIVKAAESFSNTVSIWIQRAGKKLSSNLEFPFPQNYLNLNISTYAGNFDFPYRIQSSIFSLYIVYICDEGGQILGRVLSEFYKSVEKLGFVAGGEFKAAVDEGE